MIFKGFISIGLVLMYIGGVVLPAGAAPAGPLAQVIEEAKKEGGVVLTKMNPDYTEKSMARLQKEIKEKYGVEVIVKITPSTNYSADVAQAIMEHKAGTIPSYDLLAMSNHLTTGMKAGVLERVDWKPLLSKGTNPQVVHDSPLMQGSIVYMTAHSGLLYNPEKVRADDVPKALSDLANPKWKGRVGIASSRSIWLRWSYVLGKEKVLSALRAIMKNGAIQGAQGVLQDRYLLGEIWFSTVSSDNLKQAERKAMPAAWQTLDFADTHETHLVVRKGARHANLAKLVALHLASPEGAKFTLEEAASGNLYYPGNYEHDISAQNKKKGTPDVLTTRDDSILSYYDTKEAAQLEKEIQLLLQTGGQR